MAQSPLKTQSSESASSVLRRLMRSDTHSADFATTLNSMLHATDLSAFISELRHHELIVFIDFLDRSLDAVAANPELQRRCLRGLRKICGLTLQLPSSHLISEGLVKEGKTPCARGGFADIYMGSYQRQRVALKCLRISAVDDARALQKTFCKEVLIWKRLNHPHVLPFLGVSTSVSQMCMVSEWMEHGNIMEYLKAHPESNRLQLLLDVAKGLEYLHSAQVVHADLKGHNIVIDKNGRALLADFGLASISGDPVSRNASTPGKDGTVRWMGPELLDPNIPDNEVVRPTEASDVYAFAMVVIEVFTGKVPFHKYRTELAALKMLGGSRPQRPTDGLVLGLTDEIWNMVCSCWQNKPEKRPDISEVLKCFATAVSTFDPSALRTFSLSRDSQKTSRTSTPRSHSPSHFGSTPSLLESMQGSATSFQDDSGTLMPGQSRPNALQKRTTTPQESFDSLFRTLNAVPRNTKPHKQGHHRSSSRASSQSTHKPRKESENLHPSDHIPSALPPKSSITHEADYSTLRAYTQASERKVKSETTSPVSSSGSNPTNSAGIQVAANPKPIKRKSRTELGSPPPSSFPNHAYASDPPYASVPDLFHFNPTSPSVPDGAQTFAINSTPNLSVHHAGTRHARSPYGTQTSQAGSTIDLSGNPASNSYVRSRSGKHADVTNSTPNLSLKPLGKQHTRSPSFKHVLSRDSTPNLLPPASGNLRPEPPHMKANSKTDLSQDASSKRPKNASRDDLEMKVVSSATPPCGPIVNVQNQWVIVNADSASNHDPGGAVEGWHATSSRAKAGPALPQYLESSFVMVARPQKSTTALGAHDQDPEGSAGSCKCLIM